MGYSMEIMSFFKALSMKLTGAKARMPVMVIKE
jgi:hypothetical protein